MNIHPAWTGTQHNSIYPDWLLMFGSTVKKFTTYVHGIIYYRLKGKGVCNG